MHPPRNAISHLPFNTCFGHAGATWTVMVNWTMWSSLGTLQLTVMLAGWEVSRLILLALTLLHIQTDQR